MSDSVSIMTYLQAYDDHVRRHAGLANQPEGTGLLAVLEHAGRQLGLPIMTDADRPAAAEADEATPEQIPT